VLTKAGKGDDVCVANCDYVPNDECNANKPCELGCCSKFGVCGMGADCLSSLVPYFLANMIADP
jgi:hypothetical protein